MSIQMNRRAVLGGLAGAAVASTVGLSACGNDGPAASNDATVNASVTLPTYIRYEGVTPDLPGTDEGVDPAFRKFPTDRPKSVAEMPGSGSDAVSAMAPIYYAVPQGPPKNAWWGDLNTAMGINMTAQMVPNADYPQKFATTIAGNDLPDVTMMQVVANFPQLLDKRFQPLDEFLAGDAVKDYPNLANIPTRTWKSSIYNGKIYGIPIPRGAIGNYNFVRQDIFEKYDLPLEPESWAQIKEMATTLTNPKERRWAFGLMGQPRQLLQRINDEPNVWAEEGGKLTHTFETEQYARTISDLIELWKSGVIHPDAFNDAQPFKQLFNAGTVAINAHDGYPGWTQYILDNASNPNFKLGLMTVPKRDGGGLAQWHYGSGVYAISSIKKSDPDRVKLILRMLNYLAAPFGTEEYFLRLYGKEGRDHTLNADGDPTFTAEGQKNTVVPVRYLADAPYTIYQPGRPQDADTQHAYQSKEIPNGKANPVIGLFSNVQATKGVAADTAFNDAIDEIVQGRKPYESLKDLIQTWQNAAGNEVRKEYEAQLQAQ